MLIANKLWSIEEEEKIIPQYKKEIDRHFVAAENYGEYPLNDVFQHLYTDTPDNLNQQKIEYERYLRSREENK